MTLSVKLLFIAIYILNGNKSDREGSWKAFNTQANTGYVFGTS